jgi:hypothetical protein
VSHVEDRWHVESTGPEGKRSKSRTTRYGTGLRWRVRYLTPDGRERNRSFRTREEAEAFRDNTSSDLRKGTYIDPGCRAGHAAGVRRQLVGDAGRLGGQHPGGGRDTAALPRLPEAGCLHAGPARQRPSIVQGWLAGPGVSAAYRRTVLTTLSTIMKAAVKDGLITRNPCSDVTRPKGSASRVEPWSAEQVAAVRAALPEAFRILVDLGAGLGLRQG